MLKVQRSETFLLAILMLLLTPFLIQFNKDETRILQLHTGKADVKYERAKIVRVISEDLTRDEKISGLYRGSQELEIKLLTGDHKGEVHLVKNYLSNLYNIHGKAGLDIIACIDTADPQKYLVSVYSYYRAPVLYLFILLFFLILWGVGGRKGLKSIAGLVFTFVCVIFLFIPMLHKGYSPVLASVLTAVLTACASLLLIGGWSFKTLSAILGTTSGVIIAGIASSIAGSITHISGFSTEEAETLIVIAKDSGMQVGGLLFAGILIASLGAVMDMSMSVASAIFEVYAANTGVSRKDLFLSGMNIGRDMMGTMSNTLILAFTGTSLTSLILIYSYGVSYNQLMNMNMVSIEIIQGISGSIAIILTVPVVSFISSRFIPPAGKAKNIKKK